MSPFSPAVVWMKQWKPCSFNYTPASISPAASFALSCCAVSQASSCLLLCKVIEMRRQAPSQTHRVPVTDTWALQWPIPSVKTGKRSPKQNKLLPFISFHCKGQKTWASPITQELPYIHCFEFFFPWHNDPKLLIPIPKPSQENKVAKRRAQGVFREAFYPAEVSLCDACIKLPLANIFKRFRSQLRPVQNTKWLPRRAQCKTQNN